MAKIDAVEDTQKILNEIAKAANLQRYLLQNALSAKETTQRAYAWLFDAAKRELSSKLSILEAYFTSSNEFEEFDNCVDLLTFLDSLISELNSFLSCQKEDFIDDEEGGMDNA